MKTTISLPDELSGAVDGLAARLRISRSELCGLALKEFLARHAPDQVTEALNVVCGDLDTQPNVFVARAARQVLERSEW
jgi:metal-responsive CopG/Arc/MetJ family transcriptional regulator